MNDTWTKIERIFCSICCITAIYFTLFCLYTFGLDKDLCTVTFKKFYQTEEDVFPSLSLCFKNPFIENDLGKAYDDENETYFLNYLKGIGDMSKQLILRHESFEMNVDKYWHKGYWISW